MVEYEDLLKKFTEHETRIKSNAQVNKEDVNIFECVFFQNNICEILFYHNLSKEKIIEYLRHLIEPVKHLNPVLMYLSQPSIAETIKRVSKKRRSDDKNKIMTGFTI